MVERLVLVAILGTALLGASDALAEGARDHAVLFTVVVVLVAVLLARPLAGRRSVTLREDLVRWLHRRSWLTGEAVPQILDRAVATYRSSIIDEDAVAAEGPGPSEAVGGGGGRAADDGT